MNQPITVSNRSIEAALQSADLQCHPVAHGRWSVTAEHDGQRTLELRRDGDWLTWTEDGTRRGALRRLKEAVSRNAGFPADLKLTINTSRQIELRSEVWLTEELGLEQTIRRVIDAFRRVWSGSAPIEGPPSADLDALEQLCTDAGWSGIHRAGGGFTVPLGASSIPSAWVTACNEGIRMRVVLGNLAKDSELIRTASVALAMEIACIHRRVRATLIEKSGELLFEIGWDAAPTIDGVDLALDALRAAVLSAAETVPALCHQELARDYLRIRMGSSKLPALQRKPR